MSGSSPHAAPPATSDTLETTDIALVAFYLLNGLELEAIVRKANGTSVDCTFRLRDPDQRADSLGIRWATSPEQRFDSQLRSLRKLVTEKRRGR
jgi:hypothetical protein